MKLLLPIALMGASGLALITGCGQKGPLYMPDQATEIVTRPTQTPPADAPPAPGKTPGSPQNTDSSQPSANPASDANTPDKQKKEPGVSTPR